MKRHLLVALAVLILVLPGLILFGSCSPPAPELKPKAAIIDQLYVLRPNQAFINKTTELLETYGFEVDIYQGDEVTVDFYRKLAEHGYKLIIFRVHSGLLGILRGSELEVAQGTWLFTNEAYTKAKYPSEQLTEQLVKARIRPDYPWVFAIGSKFISQSMTGQFPNTVIIMMGCSSFADDDLVEAFLDRGAVLYTGWSATLSLEHADRATISLLENLLAADRTIGEAIDATMADAGRDPVYGARLKFAPESAAGFTVSGLLRNRD